jgi:tripartite-type tricarboxylate transporter receptor subunit TctC
MKISHYTRLSRRVLGAATLATLTLLSTGTLAQSWPSKPVKMIVPAGAGSAPDVIARLIGERLSQTWGQGVVVDNRPGAGGIPVSYTHLRAHETG